MYSGDGFLNHDTINILGWKFFVVGDYLVYYRMYSSIPDLYPLDGSSSSHHESKKSLQILPFWGGEGRGKITFPFQLRTTLECRFSLMRYGIYLVSQMKILMRFPVFWLGQNNSDA